MKTNGWACKREEKGEVMKMGVSSHASKRECNGQSPPLANIVLFRLFLSGFPSKFLKRVC